VVKTVLEEILTHWQSTGIFVEVFSDKLNQRRCISVVSLHRIAATHFWHKREELESAV
jgi:hypothetical protein